MLTPVYPESEEWAPARAAQGFFCTLVLQSHESTGLSQGHRQPGLELQRQSLVRRLPSSRSLVSHSPLVCSVTPSFLAPKPYSSHSQMARPQNPSLTPGLIRLGSGSPLLSQLCPGVKGRRHLKSLLCPDFGPGGVLRKSGDGEKRAFLPQRPVGLRLFLSYHLLYNVVTGSVLLSTHRQIGRHCWARTPSWPPL